MPEKIDTAKKRHKSQDLAIRIKIGEHIGINRTVILVLNNPAYLNFWWGEDGKVLAVSTSEEPMGTSISVPNYFYHANKGSKIMHWKLMKAIQTLTGWEDKSVHRLIGQFIPEMGMVVFKTVGEGHEFE